MPFKASAVGVHDRENPASVRYARRMLASAQRRGQPTYGGEPTAAWRATSQQIVHSRQNAHLTFLRYLAGQKRSQQTTIASRGAGRFGGNLQVPAGVGVGGAGWKGIQAALATIGLGGAAHPIRRVEHPGGAMVVPGVGRGAAGELANAFRAGAARRAAGEGAGAGFRTPSEALERANMGAETGAPAGLHDAYQAMVKSKRASDAAAMGVAVAGVGGGYAGLFAMAGEPLWRRSSWKGPWIQSSGPGVTGPSKRQAQNQAATDARVHAAFKHDTVYLLRSKQIQPADAKEFLSWAASRAAAAGGTVEIRNARNYIRDNYKPPPAGWPKAP
jgi:hypothetical protein